MELPGQLCLGTSMTTMPAREPGKRARPQSGTLNGELIRCRTEGVHIVNRCPGSHLDWLCGRDSQSVRIKGGTIHPARGDVRAPAGNFQSITTALVCPSDRHEDTRPRVFLGRRHRRHPHVGLDLPVRSAHSSRNDSDIVCCADRFPLNTAMIYRSLEGNWFRATRNWIDFARPLIERVKSER
jgi:hypothetical protein